MPGLYGRFNVEVDGNILTAANYNGEHDNHITNAVPDQHDDYSSSVSQMKSTVDPGEVGTESLATSLAGELERIRFALKEAKGTAEWYPSPETNLAAFPKAAGQTYDLGITYAAGVLTITDAAQAALSATNYGRVCMPSVTPGKVVYLKAKTPRSFNDDAHANSDLTNLGFGVTETAHWAEDVPFFLYAVNRGDTDIDGVDGNSAFFLSRSPCMATTPSSADDIGDTDTIPVNDSQTVILLLGSYTQANYVSLPCQVIGALRMRWSTTTDDWTVQALANSDGIGPDRLRATFAKVWTFPTGQNGAYTGRYVDGNGGTAPVFSDNYYFYMLSANGWIDAWMWLNGDGGTDGSGSEVLLIALPAIKDAVYLEGSSTTYIGQGRVDCATFDQIAMFNESGNMLGMVVHTTSGGYMTPNAQSVTDGDFTSGARTIYMVVRYKAYRS